VSGQNVRAWAWSLAQPTFQQYDSPFSEVSSLRFSDTPTYGVSTKDLGLVGAVPVVRGHVDALRFKMKRSGTASASDYLHVKVLSVGMLVGQYTVQTNSISTSYTTYEISLDGDVLSFTELKLYFYRDVLSPATVYVAYYQNESIDAVRQWPKLNYFIGALWGELDWTPIGGTSPPMVSPNFGKVSDGSFESAAVAPYVPMLRPFEMGHSPYGTPSDPYRGWSERWYQIAKTNDVDPYTIGGRSYSCGTGNYLHAVPYEDTTAGVWQVRDPDTGRAIPQSSYWEQGVIAESSSRTFDFVWNSSLGASVVENRQTAAELGSTDLGKIYFADWYDYRHKVGPYSIRAWEGVAFTLTSWIRWRDQDGTVRTRGWVSYYDTNGDFLSEDYGDWIDFTSVTPGILVAFTGTFPSGAEYAKVGWQSGTTSTSTSGYCMVNMYQSVLSNVFNGSGAITLPALFTQPPRSTSDMSDVGWNVTSDRHAAGRSSLYSAQCVLDEDGETPWLTYSMEELVGMYAAIDNDETQHTGQIINGEITDRLVWASWDAPMGLPSLDRAAKNYGWPEWYYHNPPMRAAWFRFSAYAEEPCTFKVPVSTWNWGNEVATEWSTARGVEENLYLDYLRADHSLTHPGGGWETFEIHLDTSYRQYEMEYEDRYVTFLVQVTDGTPGTIVGVDDFFVSDDYEELVGEDKLTIGVAEWVRGDHGEYIGAKLWFKIGTTESSGAVSSGAPTQGYIRGH